MDVSINGGFISWKIILKWIMTGGSMDWIKGKFTGKPHI
jgi:hypothetical protein